MRTSIIIGFHASGTPVMFAGPDVPMDEQKKALKELRASGIHENFARVELWESGAGLTRTVKLQTSAAAKQKKAKLSEDQATQKANQAKPVKPQKNTAVDPAVDEADGPTLDSVAGSAES